MKFTHLHVHSHYSLLDGLSQINVLVSRAKELGMESMALTDHGNLYGAIEFYKKAKAAGIKPIIGCEVYVAKNGMNQKRANIDDEMYHLILLAKDLIGYKNLLKLITAANLEGYYYKPRVDKDLLRKHSAGLIAGSACLGGEIPRALLSDNFELGKKLALEYKDIFGDGNFFLELQQQANSEDQNFVNPKIIELSRQTNIPMIATQDSHYPTRQDAQAQDILLAVQTNDKIDDQERLTMKDGDFSFLSGEEMYEKFSTIKELTPEELNQLFENTQRISDQCNLELPLGKIQLPYFEIPSGFKDQEEYLKNLCLQGLLKRYNISPETKTEEAKSILDRLEYELSIIKQAGFASYFLIVQDFVNWAKNNGIITGPGRGSAAGSLVSFLLNITNIDPLKYKLIFERFLNPERISMPDIDLDFDDARRHEVVEYVSNKYGRDHVAQIITFGTMASRGAIRDAGRALGHSYEFCDQIAKMIPLNTSLEKSLETVAELKTIYDTNPQAKNLIDSAIKLEGTARHASTHACGVVISKDKLSEQVPLQFATQQDDKVIVTQYEMHSIEDLGLLKMDFLGLANLTIMHDALRQIEKNYGVKLELDKLDLDDKQTFKLLQEGKTTGVFQLESSGMKRYLKELKPTEMEDIIAMVALYRPGPMEMIPQYVARKHGKEKVSYLHPLLEPILQNTYGIMVYQEQLLQAVRALAGFSLGEADVLRKAVGKKIAKLLQEQKEKYFIGCDKNGIPKQTAESFWKLIEPFDRYGFNRSHAACYAMIAYQTAYLKAHYPIEFMAALMNSWSGDIERIAFLIDEAKSMGIKVLPPDINESFEGFTVTPVDRTIRFGLTAVKNVGVNVVSAIIQQRDSENKYKSLEDFVTKVQSKDLNKKSLESLIKCGALDNFGERNQLLSSIEQLLQYSKESQRHSSFGQMCLFSSSTGLDLPAIKLASSQPASKTEKLTWEKDLLGLYISDHPFREYQETIKMKYKVTPLNEAETLSRNNTRIQVAGLITKIQKIITKNGNPMMFVWIEDLTSKIELVVFPSILEKYPTAWQEKNIVVVKGKLSDKDGSPKIICDEVISNTTQA